MQYTNFIKEVQSRAGLEDKEKALKALKTTFNVLSKRLMNEEAEHLKAQLPDEMKSFIQHDGDVEKFSLNEFFEQIGKSEGTSLTEAEKHARTVTEVLSEAISQGEVNHIKDSLPKEFEELFVQDSERR